MKVLVAEDHPLFQSVLRRVLGQWGYEVVLAGDGAEALRLLREPGAPRLAILDWMMPAMDGVDVCRRVREECNEPYIYILLLTARSDHSDLLEGMDAGADDYVTKPFKPPELRARLRAGRRILELQEQLLRAQESLREQATHDGLTGLWNRTVILDILHNELARAGRQAPPAPVAVVMADLDRFKDLNDTFGHRAGDEALGEAARRLSGSLRRYDSLGRYGGEEFLVVLPGCDEAGAAAQAERLRRAVGSEPFRLSRITARVTVSLGVSWTDAPHASQADWLVRTADEALYAAKRAGRDRVELASLAEPATA